MDRGEEERGAAAVDTLHVDLAAHELDLVRVRVRVRVRVYRLSGFPNQCYW